MKILIVGPSWVGDMVMAQTLFKLIKQRHPEAIIDVLAPAWCEALLTSMPEVNQAIPSPFAHGELGLKQRFLLAKQLRKQNYQQAILLPNSFKSALIPWLARIPIRTGWLGEYRFGLLNDIRYLKKSMLPLMIQRFAALGMAKSESLPEKLPWPELRVAAAEVTATLERLKITNQAPILAICPGAEYGPAKRWPTGYFAELARAKLTEGWQVWLLGSKKDAAIAAEIQSGCKGACIDLTGKTNLQEAVHLLSQATAVVSNDSGLMHVAAALQRPLVVIYGSSSPKFTPPLTNHVRIISLGLSCSPCFARECPLEHFQCMQELRPFQVLAALNELIADESLSR